MSVDTTEPRKFSNFDIKFHYARFNVNLTDDAVEVFSFATQLLDDATGMFAISTVRCNPKDNFCRKTGRTLAAVRLKNFILRPDAKALAKYCTYIQGQQKEHNGRKYWALPPDFKESAIIHWDDNTVVIDKR